MRKGPFYIPESTKLKIGPYFITKFVCSDGKECVCLTTVTQALCNSFQVFELPSVFRDIRKLEEIIILKRLLFKNVKIMPKSGSKNERCNP